MDRLSNEIAYQYLILSKMLNEDNTGLWRHEAEREIGKKLSDKERDDFISNFTKNKTS